MNHLCVGCGICAALCPQGSIQMEFSPVHGFFLPSRSMDQCDTACGFCERVCPFVPENSDTAEISRGLFGSSEGIRHDDVLGYFHGTFAGYSEEHRMTSASGGLVTWLLETLLERGEIDGALCVGPDSTSPTLFGFRLCHTRDDIRSCAGSCYQPVDLSGALRELLSRKGSYAVVALPCVARSLRLAMQANPQLRPRIRFIIGLVCGQMKSRHFVDYLIKKLGVQGNPLNICFRHKRPDRPASDFAFRFALGNGHTADAGWSECIARPWGERWFTLEVCDYCDDVFAECADATFMDAWLPEYVLDPRGHSLAIVRALKLLSIILREARLSGISLAPIVVEKVCESQLDAIHQKRTLAILHKNRSRSPESLPMIRSVDRKLRPDHQWEALTKGRIRSITQHGIASDVKTLERRVRYLATPWTIANKLLMAARLVRQMVRGEHFE